MKEALNEAGATTDAVMKGLLEMVAGLKAEVETLKAAQAKRVKDTDDAVKRADRPGTNGAWMITALPSYSGTTAGIEFVNGVGFVDVEIEGADKIVHQLEHDFHYTITPLEADELGAARKIAAARKTPGGKSVADKLARGGIVK